MSGLVDRGLAETIALRIAGREPAGPGDPRLGEHAAAAAAAVLAYTGLRTDEPLPEAEWIDRAGWIRINLENFTAAAELIETRVGDAGQGAGVLGKLAAVEAGVLLGYASKRVLGQYEFPVLGDADSPRAPRLLFLAPNIAAASAELGADPDELLRWIALHEVTHAVHFGAAPWLRGHVGSLARELIGKAELRLSAGDIGALARRLLSGDPRRLIAEVRNSDPITLLAPGPVRPLIAEIQTTMALVEGFAEHVMDAAAGPLGVEVAELRVALERRRGEKPPLARLLAWLLGMEMKLRQYREGKLFVDAVVDGAGIEGLNQAWSGPESLPRADELSDPQAWIARVTAQSHGIRSGV